MTASAPRPTFNPAIEEARSVALHLLKPSTRDLEYGLALHREALVFESYSLGLRAPLDAPVINAAVEGGASAEEMNDLSGDQWATGWVADEALREEYRQTLEAAGVTCLCINAGEEGNHPDRLLRRLARLTFLIDMMPDLLARAATPADIVAAHRAGKRCLYLTTNGVPLPGRHLSVEEELAMIRVFAQLGVRMMHLTYNRRNLLADGCAEKANAGLSDFGHAVVAEMNRCGVIIDLAHTGWQSSLEAARVSTRPVVASHTAAHALNAHLRAKPDEVIRAIVESGGTVGITNIPEFLGRSGDIHALLDHLDYMVHTFGAGSVTIGTDSSYRSCHPPAGGAALQPRPRRRIGWENFWPKGFLEERERWKCSTEARSLAWTNWPLFTVGLVQRGYDDETIRGIIGGNLLRVAEGVWSGSALLERTPAHALNS
ncbi:MAG TPA: membrane dipeptidase [Chthoniobacteraceae bacterium]|nr:membrane dipeptidase [Chthoniobacteraceae bacterium]